MRNKRLYATVALLATGALLFTGCGSNNAEPVNAEPTQTISEIDTEESKESLEPTPSPTVEPTETTVEEKEEIPSGEIVEAEKPIEQDNTDNGMTGEDTDMTGDEYHEQLEQAQEEANEADQNLNESAGIEIVEELDKTMYAQQNCNSRSGDGTNYDKIASIEKGAQLHVTGRTSNNWYRVEWGSGVVYIAGSLLGDTAPSNDNTNSTNNGSGGGNNQTTQPSIDPETQKILDEWRQEHGGGSIGPTEGTGWNWV